MTTTKTRRSPSAKAVARQEIDCEVCREYRGQYFACRFECAKGHVQEKTWTLKREACDDFKRMTRDEQILKRFHHSARFKGDEEIKKRRTEVRRTVTIIRNTVTEFGELMSAAQIDALKAAQAQLASLGDDMELAGRLAKRVFEAAEAERQRKETERRAALVAKHVGDQDLVALCDDLTAFRQGGEEWLQARRKTSEAYVQANDLHDLMLWFEAYKRAQQPEGLKTTDRQRDHYVFAVARSNPLPQILDRVRTLAALVMADMEEAEACRYASKRANLADFMAFREWRQSVNGALQTIKSNADSNSGRAA